MEKEIRIQEILNSIKAFGNESYSRKELLSEYCELEKELADLTFSDSHSAYGKLNLSDVEKHLDDINDKCEHIADYEMKNFRNSCSWLRNLTESAQEEKIKESSKESKALNNLYMLRVKKNIIKDLKIRSEDHTTEIDAVIITEKAVFMTVLIKNGSIVTIDENGFMDSDKVNIAAAMKEKEEILRDVLRRSGCRYLNIVPLVVFTNSRSKICCNCDEINYAFITNINYIIEKYSGCPVYNGNMISAMSETVSSASENDKYYIKCEISLFKHNFAEIMAVLEKASEKRSEAEDAETKEKETETADDLSDTKAAEDSNAESSERVKYNEKNMKTKVRPPEYSSAGNSFKKRKHNALIWAAELAAVIGAGIMISKMIRSSGR